MRKEIIDVGRALTVLGAFSTTSVGVGPQLLVKSQEEMMIDGNVVEHEATGNARGNKEPVKQQNTTGSYLLYAFVCVCVYLCACVCVFVCELNLPIHFALL